MITTAGSIDYTPPALDTFFAYTEMRLQDQFYLIDNDGEWAKRQLSSKHQISNIINPEPLSFASNSNQLIRIALESKSDLFILNNDLIFTADWCTSLDKAGLSICCPLSNREVQYVMAIQVVKTAAQGKIFSTPMEMGLESYFGNEYSIQALAQSHRNNTTDDFLPVLVMPYFCVRIPFEVLRVVGFFDEEYGKGGAEDYDYSLRAYRKVFRLSMP